MVDFAITQKKTSIPRISSEPCHIGSPCAVCREKKQGCMKLSSLLTWASPSHEARAFIRFLFLFFSKSDIPVLSKFSLGDSMIGYLETSVVKSYSEDAFFHQCLYSTHTVSISVNFN